MSKISIYTGMILFAVGIGGFAYAGFETKAITALIPSVIGMLMAFCGYLSLNVDRKKHAMHAAFILGLLGFLLPTVRLGMLMSKDSFSWKFGACMLSTATLVTLAFTFLCVRSFMVARQKS